MDAEALMKLRLTVLEKMFRVCIHWNPDLLLWQVDGQSSTSTVPIHEPGFISSVTGPGAEQHQAVADFWLKLTSLPKSKNIRVFHTMKEWYDYHWDGEQFVEVGESNG